MSSADPYRKAQPGEKLTIHATTWNRMVDLVRPAASSNPGDEFSYRRTNFRVYCQNNTAAVVPRWGVLQIDDVLPIPTGTTGAAVDQFESQPAVAGIAPNSTNAGGSLIAVEPIEPGRIGMAAIDGVVQSRVQVRCTGHNYARPKSGETGYLESADCGPFRILWVGATGPIPTGTSGPGTPWALVRFGTETDPTKLPGHSTGSVQMLGHGKTTTGASGCDAGLQWYSVTECSGTPSYTSSYFF